ncbi:MAG: sigma-70 family RNA polymerase sigma factor [Firmicutes bacterium]|nr:sigma-70 family RNA polymerase sigma factor [Bacillota bacterium]
MKVTKQELKTLFKLYYKKVFYAAYYVTKDKYLSEDITQETFIKAYKKLHQLRDTEKLEAWLFKIAINLAHDELKRRKKNVIVPDLEFEKNDSGNNDPEDIYLKKETSEILNQLNLSTRSGLCSCSLSEIL